MKAIRFRKESTKNHMAFRLDILWIFHFTLLITLIGGTHVTLFIGVDLLEVSVGFGLGKRE